MPGASCELDAGLKETGTMNNLTFSADTRNRNVGLGDEAGLLVLTDIEKLNRDRAWWREEAVRVGTDWQTLAEATAAALASAGILQPDTMPHWDAPSWRQAAKDYHEQRGGRASTETIEPKRLARLCQLMDPGVTPDGAWHEINRCRPAPKATIDALMLSLRRGIAELIKPETLQRLSVLDDGQIEDVCLRVQAFQPAIGPTWSAADADLLISAWRKLREQHR
jgi:hypothetical protein